ncbi:MAG: hypothetical protein VB042_07965 [Victivallaceae bacterium]|nr:hypothetical protein [Victivallaceae bacterium]
MSKFENDPFHASWRFIRYDEPEVFDYTASDWDAAAREIAHAGFTHVMTFSNTHFRWSYRRFWPKLNDTLKLLVEACHRYGLYVVEHHSANLLYTANAFRQTDQIASRRLDAFHRWEHLEDDSNPDCDFLGVRLGSMFQIDGNTGEPQESLYTSYVMCHNNPDYMRLYKDYLAGVYATGVDGIMTDDVQFLADGYAACGCPSCREKFKSEYGEELPANGAAWTQFISDETAPLFFKWKKFRFDSIVEFHNEIKRHYESLGYKMMRPNFAATCVSWRSPWGGIFSALPVLDWAFIEHCCGVIRYSWPEYLMESAHCNTVARTRGIPAMSLYYPTEADQQKLAWALSLYAGHRYFGDPSKLELFEDQERFHRFENVHFDALFKYRQLAGVAILDCARSREIDPWYNSRTARVVCGAGQAMTRFNVPWAMADIDHPEDFANFSLIVVPAVFLSDDEIGRLAGFARSGGRLLWVEHAGSWSPEPVAPRSPARLRELLAGADVVFRTVGDLFGGVIKRCSIPAGEGREAFNCAEDVHWRPLDAAETARSRAAAELAASVSGGGRIVVEPEIPDLLVTAWYSGDAPEIALKICNACGTHDLPEQPGFGEKDPIPFPGHPPVRITFRKPEQWKNAAFGSASAYTLDGMKTVGLEIVDSGETLTVACPLDKIHEFMLIELKK